MFKLQQKKKEEADKKVEEASNPPEFKKQMSVRSRFLTQEVTDLQSLLPSTCSLEFKNVDDLRQFTVIIKPEEGYWKGGRFVFIIRIPPEYNLCPPIASCQTRIWHPNITEDGKICLSILREHAIDGSGWLPTRTLKDVVWGVNSLFTDLLNFDDPLNTDAADQYSNDRKSFERKARDFTHRYAK